jgi:GTP-binding protein
VATGSLRVGDKIKVLRHATPGVDLKTVGSGTSHTGTTAPAAVGTEETKVTKIFKRVGLERVPVAEAVAGDIVAVAGSEAGINDTIAAPSVGEALDPGHVDPPTLR